MGAGTILVIEIGVVWILGELFNVRIIPKGLGWVIIPVLTGIAGAKLATEIPYSSLLQLIGTRRLLRYVFVGFLSWWATVATYAYLMQPFGYYMDSRDWTVLFKWLLIPPTLAMFVVMGFRWASRSSSEQVTTPVGDMLKSNDQGAKSS
jgi:hypothetical protein